MVEAWDPITTTTSVALEAWVCQRRKKKRSKQALKNYKIKLMKLKRVESQHPPKINIKKINQKEVVNLR